MDVAYTIQKDLEEEMDQTKQQQLKVEQRMKDEIKRQFNDKEESLIKWMIEAYYTEVITLMNHVKEYKPEKEDEMFKRWHHLTAEKQLKAQGLIPPNATL